MSNYRTPTDPRAQQSANRRRGFAVWLAPATVLALIFAAQLVAPYRSSAQPRARAVSLNVSAAAGASPVCTVSQLRAGTGGLRAATGHMIAEFFLTNKSAGTCTLRGYAHVQMLGATGRRITTIDEDLRPGSQGYFVKTPPKKTIILNKGKRAWFVAQFTDMGFANVRCPTAASLLLTPPHRTRALHLTGPAVRLSPYGNTTKRPCGVLALTPLTTKRFY